MRTRDAKAERHRRFWERRNEGGPLLGVVVGGWSRFLDNPAADGLWGEGLLTPEMLRPEEFADDWRELLNAYEDLGDDLFHTAQPFPAVPWLEAVAGCPIRRSERHFWAEPAPEALDDPDRIVFDPANPWVRKYVDFLDALDAALSPEYAVAQSIVRGPVDVASAMLGETQLVFALHDAPERAARLLERVAALGEAFLAHQAGHVPRFRGGTVIGQYEIWAPGWALRLQDDGVSLLSPGLYERFAASLDARMTELTPYNMFHLHTTSLHVLPRLLDMPGLGAVEISKDEGVADLSGVLPSLARVQAAGRPLALKGRFDKGEIDQALGALEPEGLCVQAVVDTVTEAEETLSHLRDRPRG